MGKLGEVSRLAPVQRSCGRDIGHKAVARGGDICVELLLADRDVLDLTVQSGAQHLGYLCECHMAGTGDLVACAQVAVFGQGWSLVPVSLADWRNWVRE